jgi:Tol biopolymer transport system component
VLRPRLLLIALAGLLLAPCTAAAQSSSCDPLAAGYEVRELPFVERTLAETWSPDGSRLVFADREGRIKSYDVASGRIAQIADPPVQARNPVWTRDGRIFFSVRADDGAPGAPNPGGTADTVHRDPPRIFVMRDDGSGLREVEVSKDLPHDDPSLNYHDSSTPAKVSPDGRLVGFSVLRSLLSWELYLADVADGPRPKLVNVRRINQPNDTFWNEIKGFTGAGRIVIGSSRGDGSGNESYNPDVHTYDPVTHQFKRYTRHPAWEETLDVPASGAFSIFQSDRANLSGGPAQTAPKAPGVTDAMATLQAPAVIQPGLTAHDLYAGGPDGDAAAIRRLTFDGDPDRGGWATVQPDLSPDGTKVRFLQHQGPADNGRGNVDRTMLLEFACPAAARSCLARSSPIGPGNIGRIRLGLTRRRLLGLPVRPPRRTRRSLRWCVKGGRGTVAAAFTRKGRVALVATTAPRHGNRRVRPGVSARRLRRTYRRRRSLGRGLVRASPLSRRLFGVRRGRVRYIAVASRHTIANRRALRSYLRFSGVTTKIRRRP